MTEIIIELDCGVVWKGIRKNIISHYSSTFTINPQPRPRSRSLRSIASCFNQKPFRNHAFPPSLKCHIFHQITWNRLQADLRYKIANWIRPRSISYGKLHLKKCGNKDYSGAWEVRLDQKRLFAYYTFTSRYADLHARTKQACQHNYKPTLHKFLKIIKEWLLVAKIIEALEQTYVAKQRHQLCSLSFQTLNTFPCRHPVQYVYRIYSNKRPTSN